jgi:hypothetical protein
MINNLLCIQNTYNRNPEDIKGKELRSLLKITFADIKLGYWGSHQEQNAAPR